MVRLLKQFCRVWLVMAGASSAFAFSLLGPINEAYQVSLIAYAQPGDLGAPKNLGEEYRRNMPVLYYSFDQNFLDYFGSNGVYAVEQAFAILNGLSNVSAYSSNLSEFPMEAQRFNYRAQALSLLDVKTHTLSLLVEQLGLAPPVRWTWALHDRFQPTGTTCPNGTTYLVIRRNFDPVMSPLDQLQPSSYVNGMLYGYRIFEFCNLPTPYAADAVEFSVDPLASFFIPVAESYYDFFDGAFFTGLTRDDVAGLRYLLRTNNMNVESTGPNTVMIATNLLTSQQFFTSNLTLLAEQALTNDAAALEALNPGLVVASTTPFFPIVVTTNVVFVFTNSPYDPVGTPAHLEPVTVLTTNAPTWYRHEFANVITNHYATSGFVTVWTTNISAAACGPYWPVGSICTNISSTDVFTNLILGDYYIFPFVTNSCGVSIVSNRFITTLYVTNAPVVATNAPGTTNVANQQFSQGTTYSFNQYALLVHPVVCQTNSVALRQGAEKITFIRKDYDSLLGQFFYPVTNEYIANTITNSTLLPLKVQRVVTQPDILFTAADLANGPSAIPGVGTVARNIPFNATNSAYPGLAGPGTIETSTSFTYNKVGPIFLNMGTAFLTEGSQIPIFTWGSFDGTTNLPVVYPNGTSLENLESQVLIQITPRYLPDGFVGTNYGVQLQAVSQTPAFQPPYSWSLAPGSPGLPPGLGLSNTNGAGLVSGTPSAVGFYDFVIRVTDSQARTSDRSFSIKINP